MTASRFGRIQRVTALVPLALLSAAATVSLTGTGAAQTVSAGESSESSAPASLPDGTTVPSEAIEAPASLSAPGVVAPGISGNSRRVVATASTSGIPSAALAAYQRAETVINAADRTCRLPWQLVAAIGRVESDHGRTNGSSLDGQGVARPGIYGIALDGTRRTSVVRDTDAGQLDNDTRFDRAVGPMQFIPSTWSVVGVDADGDAQRNPQDIDDAALATAVYLCSGDDDLSAGKGQRAAVYRYNHSTSYVRLVLSIMNAYLDGDFTSVPNETTSARYFVPDPDYTGGKSVDAGGPLGAKPQPGGAGAGAAAPGAPSAPSQGSSDPAPASPGSPDPAPVAPAPTPKPSPAPAPAPPPPPKLPVPAPSQDPVDEVLTLAEAEAKCVARGLNAVLDKPAFDKCVKGYTG